MKNKKLTLKDFEDILKDLEIPEPESRIKIYWGFKQI